MWVDSGGPWREGGISGGNTGVRVTGREKEEALARSLSD